MFFHPFVHIIYCFMFEYIFKKYKLLTYIIYNIKEFIKNFSILLKHFSFNK